MKKSNLPENLLIIISGPTGTGKSSVALKLAQIIPAEIINADSRQFYKEINAGTAKPSQQALNTVPHHLYSFLSLKENFTVFDFRMCLEKIVPQIWKRKKAAMIVGGSGLYIRILLEGIFDFPEEKKENQKQIRKLLLSMETEKLYEKLGCVDPVCASKIHPNDRIRIIRALEVWLITGIPMSYWQKQAKPAEFVKKATVKYWILTMPREKLYNVLDIRTENMLDSGWLEEVKTIIDSGLKDYLKEKAPIGYLELCDFLEGKSDWETTVETIKKRTRQYARRQITWFKKEKNAEWIDVSEMKDTQVAQLLYEKIIQKRR